MPPLRGTLPPHLPFMAEEGTVKLFPGWIPSSLTSFGARGLGSTLRTRHNVQEANICSSDSAYEGVSEVTEQTSSDPPTAVG